MRPKLSLALFRDSNMSKHPSSVELIKLTLCGPTDVAKEISLATEVITDWNCQHGEQRGFWIKHQHWSTDTYPDAQETGQGAINKQLIDSTDILVAVFWSRIGTATQNAESGTVEEIRRALFPPGRRCWSTSLILSRYLRAPPAIKLIDCGLFDSNSERRSRAGHFNPEVVSAMTLRII